MNSKSLSNNPRSHPKKPNPSSNLSRDNLLYIFNFLRSHSSDQFLSSWSRPIIPSFSTCKPHRGSIVFEHFIRFRGLTIMPGFLLLDPASYLHEAIKPEFPTILFLIFLFATFLRRE